MFPINKIATPKYCCPHSTLETVSPPTSPQSPDAPPQSAAPFHASRSPIPPGSWAACKYSASPVPSRDEPPPRSNKSSPNGCGSCGSVSPEPRPAPLSQHAPSPATAISIPPSLPRLQPPPQPSRSVHAEIAILVPHQNLVRAEACNSESASPPPARHAHRPHNRSKDAAARRAASPAQIPECSSPHLYSSPAHPASQD